jgi:hypothetical protein
MFEPLPTPVSGSDLYEIGLMAAASPEFADAYVRRLLEPQGVPAELAAPTRHWVDAAPALDQLSSR